MSCQRKGCQETAHYQVGGHIICTRHCPMKYRNGYHMITPAKKRYSLRTPNSREAPPIVSDNTQPKHLDDCSRDIFRPTPTLTQSPNSCARLDLQDISSIPHDTSVTVVGELFASEEPGQIPSTTDHKEPSPARQDRSDKAITVRERTFELGTVTKFGGFFVVVVLLYLFVIH